VSECGRIDGTFLTTNKSGLAYLAHVNVDEARMTTSNNTVTVTVTGGPSAVVGWKLGMNAQQALEAAYNQINSSQKFTYMLQFFGKQLGYLVGMINETYDTFVSPGAPSVVPLFYWEFLVNNIPAGKGIDSTPLAAGDVVTFTYTQYIPQPNVSSQLATKHAAKISMPSSRGP
jgi:hypothetical protein